LEGRHGRVAEDVGWDPGRGPAGGARCLSGWGAAARCPGTVRGRPGQCPWRTPRPRWASPRAGLGCLPCREPLGEGDSQPHPARTRGREPEWGHANARGSRPAAATGNAQPGTVAGDCPSPFPRRWSPGAPGAVSGSGSILTAPAPVYFVGNNPPSRVPAQPLTRWPSGVLAGLAGARSPG